MCVINFWTASSVDESCSISLAMAVCLEDVPESYRCNIHVQWSNITP